MCRKRIKGRKGKKEGKRNKKKETKVR